MPLILNLNLQLKKAISPPLDPHYSGSLDDIGLFVKKRTPVQHQHPPYSDYKWPSQPDSTRIAIFQDLRSFSSRLQHIFSGDRQSIPHKRDRPKKKFFTQPKAYPPSSMVTRSQNPFTVLDD